MRVSIMHNTMERVRGKIRAPHAVDLRHHVMSRQVSSNYEEMLLDGDNGVLGDVIRTGNHAVCRKELMELYVVLGGAWSAMEGWYIDKKPRQEDNGVAWSWVLTVAYRAITYPRYRKLCVSGRRALTTRPGLAVLSIIGSCSGAGFSCGVGSGSSRHPLGTMAPKRAASHPSRTASGRACTRELTKEQEKAVQSAKHYKRSVPPKIQADIAKVEQTVWEEVNQGIPEPEFDDLAGWIHDPGKTYGRIGLYQRAISYYWASKCLLAKLLVDQEQKGKEQRTGLPIPLWDSHYNDSRLMHKKLDVLAFKMGIKFVAPEPALSAKASAREGKRTPQDSTQVP